MSRARKSEAVSAETKEAAMTLARSSQKPGQSKEQTRLIAAGIEKGIDLYKKQQKAKAREHDKNHKRQLKAAAAQKPNAPLTQPKTRFNLQVIVPWLLLIATWLAAGFYLLSP